MASQLRTYHGAGKQLLTSEYWRRAVSISLRVNIEAPPTTTTAKQLELLQPATTNAANATAF